MYGYPFNLAQMSAERIKLHLLAEYQMSNQFSTSPDRAHEKEYYQGRMDAASDLAHLMIGVDLKSLYEERVKENTPC